MNSREDKTLKAGWQQVGDHYFGRSHVNREWMLLCTAFLGQFGLCVLIAVTYVLGTYTLRFSQCIHRFIHGLAVVLYI